MAMRTIFVSNFLDADADAIQVVCSNSNTPKDVYKLNRVKIIRLCQLHCSKACVQGTATPLYSRRCSGVMDLYGPPHHELGDHDERTIILLDISVQSKGIVDGGRFFVLRNGWQVGFSARIP